MYGHRATPTRFRLLVLLFYCLLLSLQRNNLRIVVRKPLQHDGVLHTYTLHQLLSRSCEHGFHENPSHIRLLFRLGRFEGCPLM